MRTACSRAFATFATMVLVAPSLHAQRGSGGDFRFEPPGAVLTVHGGLAAPTAGSELFRFTTDELTVRRSDFVAGSFGIDLALMLNGQSDFVLSYARDRSSTGSEFRDWVDNFGQPIRQTTTFLREPLTASLRYNLVPRGRQVGSLAWIPTRLVPFVGVGGGLMRYRFEQVGDFIDMGTLDVFYDEFTEKGWSPVGQLSAGASWNLNPYLLFHGEVRYLRAKGDRTGAGDDFQGFGRLDLSGMSTMFGLSLRF